MKTIASFAFLFIAGLVWWMLFYLGAFKPVQISVTDKGPYNLIFKHHVGSYHKIAMLIDEVEAWTRAHGDACGLTFGEYLDDPNSIEEDRLNANGGCVVAAPLSLPQNLAAEYQQREIPRARYVTAEFQGAPSIGPLKVYPKVEAYFKENHLKRAGAAVIETYERINSDKIRTIYLFPIAPNELK